MQIETIADILSEYNTKQISCNRLAVYTQNNRIDTLLAIHNRIAGSTYVDQPIALSSIGCVKRDNCIVVVKPIRVSYPGIDNEHYLYDKIKYHINPHPLNIVFKDRTKEYRVNNIAHANLVISSIGGKKADITLINTSGDVFSFSLKKDNAQIWESSDTYFSEEAANIIRKSNALLHDRGSYYHIDPQLAVKATSDEQRKVIFGSDIYNNGAVLIRSYRESDFVRIDNILYITVSKIIKDMRCLSKFQQVFFLIRNDKTRNGIPNYPGIRTMAVMNSRIIGNCVVLDR